MRGDGEQFLGSGEGIVQHRRVQEVGDLVVAGTRAGRRPVRAHPADIRGHRREWHGRRTDERRTGSRRRPSRRRLRPLRQLSQSGVADRRVGNVLDMSARRLAQNRAGLEDDHPQRLVEVGQLAGDGGPDGSGANDDDVVLDVVLGDHQTLAGSSSSSRFSMSCCARIWSKALYRSLYACASYSLEMKPV